MIGKCLDTLEILHTFGFNDCRYWKSIVAEPFQDTSEETGFHDITKEITGLMIIFFTREGFSKINCMCIFS